MCGYSITKTIFTMCKNVFNIMFIFSFIECINDCFLDLLHHIIRYYSYLTGFNVHQHYISSSRRRFWNSIFSRTSIFLGLFIRRVQSNIICSLSSLDKVLYCILWFCCSINCNSAVIGLRIDDNAGQFSMKWAGVSTSESHKQTGGINGIVFVFCSIVLKNVSSC